MATNYKIFAPLLFGFITAGCIEDTINLPTNVFNSDVIVRASKSEMIVSATLSNKNNKPFTVSGSEQFISNARSVEKSMTGDTVSLILTPGSSLFDITLPGNLATFIKKGYSSTYEGEYQNEQITVTFDRANDEADAVSTVMLPLPSEITAPAVNAVYTVADDIVVQWDGAQSNGDVSIDFVSDCTKMNVSYGNVNIDSPILLYVTNKARRVSFTVDDTGSYTLTGLDALDLGALEADPETTYTVNEAECSTKVFLTRRTSGTLSEFLSGGSVIGETVRQLDGVIQINK
ncbi:Uncharacterised protein [BD1-7 clade bacterium]|uniref:Uncharacterized protein n=1 Tax=BD1-7 clade bacterium TaxID=2029982 RepID=A0A5S9NQ51_9GAMM|nr:Uncharacterised protein [BD1-7 clade bacterium]